MAFWDDTEHLPVAGRFLAYPASTGNAATYQRRPFRAGVHVIYGVT
jgi:hypothetical protein